MHHSYRTDTRRPLPYDFQIKLLKDVFLQLGGMQRTSISKPNFNQEITFEHLKKTTLKDQENTGGPFKGYSNKPN